MQRAAIAVVEYLLGFFSLAVFAAYAFAQGAPTQERWVSAFKLGACIAAIELLVLVSRKALANRLVIGANIWLLIAGLAAFTEQWWVLRGYERFGEASLFVAMLLVGFVSTAIPGGFIGVLGPRRKILVASGVLLLAVVVALVLAVVFRGNVKLAAVLPVIGLSWLNRALQRFAKGAA